MPEPRIYTTTEWGARVVTQTFAEKPAEGIVIHNTENPNRAPASGAEEEQISFGICRAIQTHHISGNGWSDTGQHFTVSRGGLILEGRTGSLAAAREGKVLQGAHASGVTQYNTKWFGIEMEGFYVHEYAVTEQQWDALVELCAWLCFWGNIDSERNIIGHMDVLEGHTDCPGLVEQHLTSLRAQVHDRVGQLP
ncbi:MAG TPA: peptidoglycan recognition family protein [Chthoniobacterales bacterium]|nr:peptidoglycan recognition family protein [Chthoniobacterales bacterium]